MMYLTRKEHFNAAHKLYKPDWTEEKNWQVFGKCANTNWHGHNYVLYVTVKGKVDKDTGFVINAQDLSKIIQKYIIEELDHKNLNLDVPFLKDILPSAENLAKAIWERLELYVTECQLHCVKLYETENIYVEYFGKNSNI